MIELVEVTKTYQLRRKRKMVLDAINLKIGPKDNVGLLGRNGAGKSTLLRLIGGSEKPDRGVIRRSMTVSWPVGFAGGMQGSSTGIVNAKFCARIYGKDPKEIVDFVDDFSELGAWLNEPIKKYSSGMRARLAFALSMAMDFDCLLIDEVMSVGDPSFRDKAQKAMSERSRDKAMVLVSHNLSFLAAHSTKLVILGVERQPVVIDDVPAGIEFYEEHLKQVVARRRAA